MSNSLAAGAKNLHVCSHATMVEFIVSFLAEPAWERSLGALSSWPFPRCGRRAGRGDANGCARHAKPPHMRMREIEAQASPQDACFRENTRSVDGSLASEPSWGPILILWRSSPLGPSLVSAASESRHVGHLPRSESRGTLRCHHSRDIFRPDVVRFPRFARQGEAGSSSRIDAAS